ncbi:helix-turn-helix domain-containing protein [Amycolatopsis palatopharyngis]|uniref:helix-turn-helix domain-containing protein n=1 Tax=Amycolatopsis palatopharyngis TaxID=187982 RepID=UPI000E2624B4|nr:helix-turn-helix transcriptional regulator [Amycolatopsis palatopharyngis]
MRDRDTTVRSRELGEGLRRAMEKAQLTGQDAARTLGWSQSRVSRLLSGKRGGNDEVEVSAFLAVCRVTGAERKRLLGLCHEVGTPGWLQQHGSRLPRQLRTLIDHEDKAVRTGDFQPMVVPGLLQTPEYARALLSGTGTLPAAEIEGRVRARLDRQRVLAASHGRQFTYFLHEFALRLPVGDSEVMSGQLHHLLRLSVRKNISLRVVPAAAGVHAGVAGAFKLMEFPEFSPVVYLDSQTASLFLEAPEEIAAHRLVLERLADISPDAGQSRELIARLAVELYPQPEERDGVAHE